MLKMVNRVEPWKFGQDISSAVDVESAISLADMAWEVVQTPALIRLADGNILETPMKVNVRSDNNAFLGVVSDRYQTVQNKDAFSFLSFIAFRGEVKFLGYHHAELVDCPVLDALRRFHFRDIQFQIFVFPFELQRLLPKLYQFISPHGAFLAPYQSHRGGDCKKQKFP